MAVVMEMVWPDVTLEQYDQARIGVRWEEEPPVDAIFHVAWSGADGLHVVDVWESEAAFNQFAADRLMPVVKGQLGLPGEPIVTFSPAHRIFDAVHGTARS